MKKELRVKGSDKLLSIIRKFSATEKTILAFFVVIMIVSALIMANRTNKQFLVSIPKYGGSLDEGIVGLPRLINPVLAFTDTDKDLSELIYSGLLKYEEEVLKPDLAEKYSISEDGLTYSFTIKDDIRFHDGELLTTEDIEFTIQKIQDGILKSPRRADWANVTIKKINAKEIQFILKQPYSPFISNTTVGILPKHIWKNVDADQFIFSQYNIEPIGSGPYMLKEITRDNGGIPQKYNLVTFNDYYGQKPYLSSIDIFFFSNEKTAIDAFNSGTIQSLGGISAEETAKIASSTKSSIQILTSPLPRIFGIFFNLNSAPVLDNKEVRLALDMSLDKKRIVNELLYGYGVSIDSPIPFGTIDSKTKPLSTNNKEAAIEILSKNGWKLNADGIMEKKDKKSTQILEFSITTADVPELKKAAEIAKSEWESIGAKIDLKIFEYGDLSQNIIKTRKYDALLFGEFIGKDLDLYAFWHSSQRNYPGLNIAMYVNSKTDKLLEKIRGTSDNKAIKDIYTEFDEVIKDELPAVFLYSPEYIYIVPEKIKGIDFGRITNSADRWNDINKWYIETDNVWGVFAKNKNN